MTSNEVIKRFIENEPNKRTGDFDFSSCQQLRGTENLLYSYGQHFPLLKRLDNGNFVLNGDSYFVPEALRPDRPSMTTAKQQREVICLLKSKDLSIVSAGALQQLGHKFEDIESENIVDFQEAWTQAVIYRKSDKNYYNYAFFAYRKDGEIGDKYKIALPKQGVFIRKKTIDGLVLGDWHIAGGILLRFKKSDRFAMYNHDTVSRVVSTRYDYYVCGIDEDTYFIAELPRKATTVTEAFELLKPGTLQRDSSQQYIRQGEFFFVDTGRTDKMLAHELGITQKDLKSMRIMCMGRALQKQNANSNNHEPAHQIDYQYLRKQRKYVFPGLFDSIKKLKNFPLLVRGKVYHRNPINGSLTGEHRAANLGDTWHVVYKNQEKRSVSQSGRFD